MPADTTGKAVQVLDLMLDFFAEDDHWTRGRYHDPHGRHCLVGAVLHFSARHGLPRAPVRVSGHDRLLADFIVARIGRRAAARSPAVSRAPTGCRPQWVNQDMSSDSRKSAIPRASSLSRIMSTVCRRSYQGEIALRKHDFISPLRYPYRSKGAHGAASAVAGPY
jgi:hypothetical protein